MDSQKIKFRVRQFNPEIDKYEDLIELDRKIFKDERNHFNAERAKEWVKVNPNIIHLLLDNLENVHGYNLVIPIKDSYAETALIEKREVSPDTLRKEYVLTLKQADANAAKEGNTLYSCLHVCNPISGKKDYQFAALLFMNMESLFYKYRMKCLICRTHTESGMKLLEDSGCERMHKIRETKDGVTWVYYFDLKNALHRPCTGMGIIMFHIWGFQGHKRQFLLDLTDKEKEVLKLQLVGYTRNEVAKLLGINVNAVEGRMRRIDEKGREIGLNDRKSIKRYAFQNFFYFV